MAKIYDSILDAVGHTPMVRMRSIGRDLDCEILAKCEFLNPGGSIKDRIGKRMLEEAQKKGRIHPGDTLIEPTSGNTGIGLALAAAVYGYRMIITMPEKMSREKQVTLEALGAEIIRTPTEAAWDAPESHIGVAKRLREVIPNSHILDQYANPDNPAAHYYEGIGYDFIPDVLDRSLVDEWIKTEDRPSFQMARRLIRQEGLLCGGSSGSAMWAALQVAKKMGPKKRIVVILADSVRNYMTKFMDDRWMKENGFTESQWESNTIGDTLRSLPRRKLITAASADTVADAVMVMKEHGISQLPVVDANRLVGIVTESDVLAKLVDGRASLSSAVAEVMFRNVTTVKANDDAGKLLEIFGKGMVALVLDDKSALLGVITKMDLVDMLTARQQKAAR